MKKNLISSAIAVVVFTLLLGLAYPLVMTGVSQVVFPNRAQGSPIKVDGKTVGSKLLAQPRLVGKKPDPRYFQPRPSQTDYNPNGTFFSNRGPNQSSARYFYRDQIAAYLQLNAPYDPGLKAADVPQDAVTT